LIIQKDYNYKETIKFLKKQRERAASGKREKTKYY